VSDLPPKTCQLDNLITHPRLVEATLAGQKTQQRRNGVYGYPGETFELQGKTLRITELKRQKLGELGESEAQAEGFPNLTAYKDVILRMHPGMPWNPEMLVWLHSFELVETGSG